MVVDGFRETNPKIENAQPAAHPSHKTVRHQGHQPRKPEQQIIVCPLQSPGQDRKSHTRPRTQQHKQ
jgi:hypothetical protein